MPPTSVYLVCPVSIARIAARLIRAGVSKSGSPAPKEITSMPCARIAFALACMASVGEGASVFIRSASMGSRLGLPGFGELLAQALLHRRRHQAGDGRAERGDLLDEARGDIRVPLVRHHEHGLHRVAELAVHQRHLELVLEVGDGAEAAHDAVRALALHQVDQQPVERGDAHPAHPDAGGAFVDQLEALLDREERLLRGVRDHRHDQLVEDAQAPLDEIQMPVVHRIEHPGIHRPLAHAHPRRPFLKIENQGNSRKRCSVYASDRKKVKVVSPKRRAFQSVSAPDASGGGVLVPCWITTTAPATSTPPAATASSAAAARGESYGGSRNAMPKCSPAASRSATARAASARTTRAWSARPRRSTLSRSARRAAPSCSTNTADGAPRESASMPTPPAPAKRSRKGPASRNGMSVSRQAMRTWSAVGRVVRPRGVVSRWPLSAPASTLTGSSR